MTDWQTTLREQLTDGRDPSWVVLEGQGMVEAALAGWWEVAGVVISEDHSWEVPVWSGMEVARVAPAEMASLADASIHGGVLGLAKKPSETGEVAAFLRSLDAEALVVVCPRLDDPRVAGEVIRLAAEHDAAGVLLGAEGVSPFHVEAVRAAGGATFQLPIRIADGGLLLRSLKAAGVELCGWEQAFSGEAVTSGRRALVMGDPEKGLGPFWKAACDRQVGGEVGEALEELAVESGE
ncbi:TrmH family RNA methyltransferase [Luteolibacter soli]|uniref:TrmH family RNA methyltransferase n=1 Tax=Luteolibacter soli TaxID=3135280 RepID=A0ABU9AMT9_9BACT